jgi:hypothetical protein
MVHDGELGLGVVFDDPTRSYKANGEAAWHVVDGTRWRSSVAPWGQRHRCLRQGNTGLVGAAVARVGR